MPLTDILWIIFLTSFIIQMVFWGVCFMRFAVYLKKKKTASASLAERPVSVIICARNEAENLKTHLPAIFAQEYSEFEVLVVNDGSTDDTASILDKFQKEHDNLTILHIGDKPSGTTGKKYALERGIRSARYPWLLLTDADCIPVTEKWIATMNEGLEEGKMIGLGYGPYQKKKGWLNKLIRFETVYTATQYFSFALWGMPYMGVGRNLFYHRKLFDTAGGFTAHAEIASGDDDLFINSVVTKSNMSVILDKKSFVSSKPEVTLGKYIRQKSRHFTTGKHYKIRDKILLSLLSTSHFLFLSTFFTLLVFEFRCTTILFLVFGLRLIFLHLVYGVILKEMKEKDLIIWLSLLDFFYILFLTSLTPALLLTNMRKWK